MLLEVLIGGVAMLLVRQLRAYVGPLHLRSLPGPERVSWSQGSFRDPHEELGATRLHEIWVEKYGHVFKYYSNFVVRGLL